MSYRTAQLDPDNRREPKTESYCVRCNKDLKPSQPRRYVRIESSSFATVVHPDDIAIFIASPAGNGDMGNFPVGVDCARIVGIDFTFSLVKATGAA